MSTPLDGPPTRLIAAAPRLGRAWDQCRRERWLAAVQRAAAQRQPGETCLEATRRIYLIAMEHNLKRAR